MYTPYPKTLLWAGLKDCPCSHHQRHPIPQGPVSPGLPGTSVASLQGLVSPGPRARLGRYRPGGGCVMASPVPRRRLCVALSFLASCCSHLAGPSRCERKDSCGWGEQGRLPGVCNFRPNLHTAGQMRIHLTDPKTLLEACWGGTPASGRRRQANVYVWSIWKILG